MTDDRLQGLLDELAAMLTAQVDHLQALEGVLRTQQRAIVSQDIQGILTSLPEQAERIDAIQRVYEARIQVTNQLANILGMTPEQTSLGEMARCVDGPIRARIETLARAGRETLDSVGRVNADNRRLIEHSLEFIDSMLSAISGRTPVPPIYEATGTMRPRPQIETLVDHSA